MKSNIKNGARALIVLVLTVSSLGIANVSHASPQFYSYEPLKIDDVSCVERIGKSRCNESSGRRDLQMTCQLQYQVTLRTNESAIRRAYYRVGDSVASGYGQENYFSWVAGNLSFLGPVERQAVRSEMDAQLELDVEKLSMLPRCPGAHIDSGESE